MFSLFFNFFLVFSSMFFLVFFSKYMCAWMGSCTLRENMDVFWALLGAIRMQLTKTTSASVVVRFGCIRTLLATRFSQPKKHATHSSGDVALLSSLSSIAHADVCPSTGDLRSIAPPCFYDVAPPSRLAAPAPRSISRCC